MGRGGGGRGRLFERRCAYFKFRPFSLKGWAKDGNGNFLTTSASGYKQNGALMRALASVTKEVKFHFGLLASTWARKMSTIQQLPNSVTFSTFFLCILQKKSKNKMRERQRQKKEHYLRVAIVCFVCSLRHCWCELRTHWYSNFL